MITSVVKNICKELSGTYSSKTSWSCQKICYWYN